MRKELSAFFHNKIYVLILGISAVCAYGFAVTHYAIGMDDTAMLMYFNDGLEPYLGRWSLFVINKFLYFADFSPWITEFVGVLIFMLSVTLWCVLWRRVCEPEVSIPAGVYSLVAGIFISSPIISEVFVFYLHNGICIGYGTTALALLCLLSGMENKAVRKKRILRFVYSTLLLVFTLGLYESFALVYILGAVVLFGLIRGLYGKYKDESRYDSRLWVWIATGASVMGGSLAVRAVVTRLFEAVFHLDKYSIYNMRYYHFFGDLLSNFSDLFMVLKRFYVKYYVNAVTYLPVRVLVAALVFVGIVAVCCGIRRRDICLPLCFAALVLFPVLMSLVEGLATRYRSAQYVPMICAFAVLLLMILLYGGKVRRRLNAVCILLLGVLLFNQCADMNKWFYLDWLKYEDAREVMLQVAYDLRSRYDISKPIVFRGGRAVPYVISSDAYVSYDSWEYRVISALTDPIDVHLKEKYHVGANGYLSPESPVISVLAWGVTAFDGTAWQLIEFWKMHGVEGFSCETDLNKIAEAEEIRHRENMPAYPVEGYIMECEDYIIVNLAD